MPAPKLDVTGIGHTKVESISAHLNTIDAVSDELAKKGFAGIQKPKAKMPELTENDLVNMTSQNFGELSASLISWFGYTGEMIAFVNSHIDQLKQMLSYIEASTRKSLRNRTDKKLSQKDIEDEIFLSPEYQSKSLLLQQATQQKRVLEIKLDYLDKCLKLLSRHLEVVKLERESTKRYL